jgi:DNA-binding CsgD family transcriptional regulator
VTEASVSRFLAGVAEATESQAGVSAAIDVRTAAGGIFPSEMLILPLPPQPSIAFALIPTTASAAPRNLRHIEAGIGAVNLSRAMADGPTGSEVAGLSHLTARELEIVHRLISGDRVPAIASALFLSQSTVRNHLASAFGKLGVRSQQELIDLFRGSVTATRP